MGLRPLRRRPPLGGQMTLGRLILEFLVVLTVTVLGLLVMIVLANHWGGGH